MKPGTESWSMALVALLVGGCGAAYHARQTEATPSAERLTVAAAQRRIAVGMSGAEVIEVLGAPNVISTDDQGREVWVWDKISTEQVRSEGGGFWTLGLVGGGGGAGASSTSQRTLTIIVKFDERGKVRDLAYRASSF